MADSTHSRYELLSRLIQDLLLGELDDAESLTLNQMLADDPKHLEYYIEYTTTWALLDEVSVPQGEEEDSLPDFDPAVMVALSNEEKTAPSVEVSHEKPSPELIQKVVYPARGKRSVPKSSIVTFILSAAAILFIIILAHSDSDRVPVAEVTKVMDAEWENGSFVPAAGDHFYTTDTARVLKSGILEITFNYGATVILEGPCEFSCKSEGALSLQSGRCFAHVLPEASGFTVATPISRIVDLGTEFGVSVASDGELSTQVFKGKTRIISNQHDGTVKSETLEAGEARKVDRTGAIHQTPFNQVGYVRSFDPERKNVWRGRAINLADIVGGGNGFGTDNPHESIPLKAGFKPLLNNSIVDGVFVPGKDQTSPVISTSGLRFKGCPATSGEYRRPISSNKLLRENSGITAEGVLYGANGVPAIFMHSNSGITFDLQKLREARPHLSLQTLTTDMGLVNISNPTLPQLGKADLWILIDGEPVNQKKRFTGDELVNVSVEIPKDARFLTLAITDAGPNQTSVDPAAPSWVRNDLCVFGKPFLHLVPCEENN